MPFAVSQWPYSPDPRGSAFDILGWNFGQVPPFKWILSTTDATGIMAIYNTGILVDVVFEIPGVTQWAHPVELPGFMRVSMTFLGFDTPQGAPPGTTKQMQISITESSVPTWNGNLDLLFPTAIAVQSPFAMTQLNPSGGDFPNPMAITPAKWNVV